MVGSSAIRRGAVGAFTLSRKAARGVRFERVKRGVELGVTEVTKVPDLRDLESSHTALHQKPRHGIVAAEAMPEYVIERDVPGAGQFTEEQIREVSLRSLAVLKGIGPQIQWLHSYVTDDRIYCVYLAPDEDTVREHARQTGIPASRVSAVRRLVDPKRYS